MVKLDSIAGFHPNNTLAKWCSDAVHLKGGKKLYLKNAKQQITVWGGTSLKDYSSREWQGLIKGYYLPRWKMFFAAQRREKQGFKEKEIKQRIVEWENEWCGSEEIPEMKSISIKELLVLVNEAFDLIL